jgi:hypothetical protein
MSKMAHVVEELRDRLVSVADQEQKLIASLRDALNRFDQKLLQDVRSIAAEHEARRSVILSELQGLASRLGVFPAASAMPHSPVDGDTCSALSRPSSDNEALTSRHPVESGAWRDATDKLQTELESYFRKRA